MEEVKKTNDRDKNIVVNSSFSGFTSLKSDTKQKRSIRTFVQGFVQGGFVFFPFLQESS